METQKRFPQGLGNLAQNARFPHSHTDPLFLRKETTKNEDFWERQQINKKTLTISTSETV
jgi:hypothetical protein